MVRLGAESLSLGQKGTLTKPMGNKWMVALPVRILMFIQGASEPGKNGAPWMLWPLELAACPDHTAYHGKFVQLASRDVQRFIDRVVTHYIQPTQHIELQALD